MLCIHCNTRPVEGTLPDIPFRRYYCAQCAEVRHAGREKEGYNVPIVEIPAEHARKARKRHKRTVLSLGSISTGTCRTEDIFPALADELSALRLSRADRSQLCKLRREFDSLPEDDETGAGEDILAELYDLGQNYCPDFCFLGSHPGDGADVGVWPTDEILDAGGYYRGEVADSRETATREHTHALEVNDHGNCTLFRRAGSRWVECWSVV